MSNSEKKTILLIDDDEMIHQVVKSITQDKYNLFFALSGDEAIKLMFQGLIPDLILLDILMPSMDGWETFSKIRAVSLLHDVPIAFLTSLQSKEDMAHGKALGAVDFLIKPIEADILLERIEKILNLK